MPQSVERERNMPTGSGQREQGRDENRCEKKNAPTQRGEKEREKERGREEKRRRLRKKTILSK